MDRRNTRRSSGRSGRNTEPSEQQASTRGAAARRQSPDVVYTQPGPFDRHRFLLRLATVVAVVLAVIFGLSIFFKVDKIQLSGINKYTAWDVAEASGIREGENLLTLNKAAVSSRILRNLPYVDQVRIGIKLPDTVNIEIVELDVVYAIQAADESWWLISAAGNVVEKTNGSVASEYSQISGVLLDSPQVGQKAKAKELPAAEDPEQTPVTVLESQRLEAALAVFQAMEDNGLIRNDASLNVERIASLEMLLGEDYQVLLGDGENMNKKIRFVKGVMEKETSGIIDVSFTQKPDEAIHTNFS